MVTVYDVAPNKLIAKAAEKLKGMNIAPPAWITTVKSGSHRDRVPQQKDFWYIRLASLLRNAYVNGKVGVSSLRAHYGGKKVRGVRPEKKRKAGG
ncbi:30S ribosomal protein S19e [uncultured archaeon]|nr:30S ribosomal protein S19e [uncultured archaeon]